MNFQPIIESVGTCIDAAGVLAIVIGIIISAVRYVAGFDGVSRDRFRTFRQNLGRAILLGLELLVAGDIIRTVAVAPSLLNVLVLGVIVLIRTFLSMSLEVELDGRWPWQRRDQSSQPVPADIEENRAEHVDTGSYRRSR
jgi:uncharacterized membrane protein